MERPLRSDESSDLFCSVCGDFFPKDSLSSHKASVHPRVQQAASRMARITFLSALPFALLIAVIIALGPTSASIAGVPLLWVAVVLLVASVSLAYALNLRLLQAALAQEQFRCLLCKGRFPRAALATHVRERHPRDRRYLRVIGVGSRLSTFVVVAMLLLVLFALIQFSLVVQDPRSPRLYLGFWLVLAYAFVVLGTTGAVGTWWTRRIREYHTVIAPR